MENDSEMPGGALCELRNGEGCCPALSLSGAHPHPPAHLDNCVLSRNACVFMYSLHPLGKALK